MKKLSPLFFEYFYCINCLLLNIMKVVLLFLNLFYIWTTFLLPSSSPTHLSSSTLNLTYSQKKKKPSIWSQLILAYQVEKGPSLHFCISLWNILLYCKWDSKIQSKSPVLTARVPLLKFCGHMYTIISPVKCKSLTSSFPICIPLIFICCLISLAIILSTIFDR